MTDAIPMVPPQHKELERAILGQCLVSNASLEEVIDAGISEHHFYASAHQIIWRTATDLYNRGMPADLVSVADVLRCTGMLDKVGDLEYLSELTDTVGLMRNNQYAISQVIDASKKRRLIDIFTNGVTQAYDAESSADDVVELADHGIFDVATERADNEAVTAGVLYATVIADIRAAHESGRPTGLSTGFSGIDRRTCGLQPGDLVIVAARPSMGKTSLALQMCMNQSIIEATTRPTAFFSLEMAKEQILKRVISINTSVNGQRISSGRIDATELAAIEQQQAVLEASKLWIDDTPGLNVTQIRAKSRKIRRVSGDLALIVIDYLQLMGSMDRHNTRNEELGVITRGLKQLAKELNIPVVVLSQLSRACEQRADKRPVLSDLRESGAIEQDGDLVMFIYRDEWYNPDTDRRGIAELNIGKQRNGPVGVERLTFEKQYARFTDYTHNEAEENRRDWVG